MASAIRACPTIETRNPMRSKPEIDADFKRLYESLRWINNNSNNDQDKQWFDEAKKLLAVDYNCEVMIQLYGNNRDQIIAFLEGERLQVSPAANPLPNNCNGTPKTCPRLAAKNTPYCHRCQAV
jgi:hypothetical protein